MFFVIFEKEFQRYFLSKIVKFGKLLVVHRVFAGLGLAVLPLKACGGDGVWNLSPEAMRNPPTHLSPQQQQQQHFLGKNTTL